MHRRLVKGHRGGVEDAVENVEVGDAELLHRLLPGQAADAVFIDNIYLALGWLDKWSCHKERFIYNALFERKDIIRTLQLCAIGGVLITQTPPMREAQ